MSAVKEFRAERARGWAERMTRQVARAKPLPSPPVEGSLTRMVGLALEASGCQAAVGDVCDLMTGDGSRVEAEVVGFAGDKLFLMPTSEVHGLAPAARVIPRQRAGSVHGTSEGRQCRQAAGTGRTGQGLIPDAAPACDTGVAAIARRSNPTHSIAWAVTSRVYASAILAG